MTGVLFAYIAGMFLGALNVTMRRGLGRVADVDAGSAVIAPLVFVVVAATAAAFGSDFELNAAPVVSFGNNPRW